MRILPPSGGFLGGFNEMTWVKYWVGQNSFGFLRTFVWKNSNELLGQPDTLPELPRWLSGKESTCQYRRHKKHRFDPCVGKIPWKRKWQPTPVFLSGESHGQRRLAVNSPWGCKKSDTTERLSTYTLPSTCHKISPPKVVIMIVISLFQFSSSIVTMNYLLLLLLGFLELWLWPCPGPKKKKQQLPESTLPTPSLLGGSPGSVIR